MAKTKQIMLLSLGILMILVLTNLAFADCIRQMHNGESIPCPNYYSTTKHMKCDGVKCTIFGFPSDAGALGVCVSSDGKKCGSGCYSGPTQDQCDDSGTNPPPTQTNLTLSANFPFANNGFYTKTSFNLDIRTNKPASIYLIDNSNGLQRNLCSSCMTYTRTYTFKQGQNDIKIRAVSGNQIKDYSIKFTIDNKKPVITKTLPDQNDYASSIFTVFYDEENLKNVMFYYGTSTSTSSNKNKTLICSSGVKKSCIADVNLTAYDGKQINYWFKITDIANNIVESKKVKVYVDLTSPKIVSFNYTITKNNVEFKIKIDEKNFDKVYYYDNDMTKAKVLCSSLNKNICDKKINFRSGSHDVKILVVDKAGNSVSKDVSFNIA
jgi:hypothetical protein